MLTRRGVQVVLSVLMFINIFITINFLWPRRDEKGPVLMIPAFVPANIEYVINNPLVCDITSEEDGVEMMMLVTSHAGNVDLRMALRRYYPREELRRLGVRRVFMLGVPLDDIQDKVTQTFNNSITQSEIRAESEEHADIIQGDFIESYSNLTLKQVMGLRWALSFCARARYIVKIDDDWVVDLYRLFDVLEAARVDELPRLFGFTYLSSEVVRNVLDDKYYIPREEYPDDNYPMYVSGTFYVTTPQAVRLLMDAVPSTPYFRMEDVYVTGLLRTTGKVEIIPICWEARGYSNLVRIYCLRQHSFKKFQCKYLTMDLNVLGTKAIPQFKEHTEYCYVNACPAQTLLEPCTRYWQ